MSTNSHSADKHLALGTYTYTFANHNQFRQDMCATNNKHRAAGTIVTRMETSLSSASAFDGKKNSGYPLFLKYIKIR